MKKKAQELTDSLAAVATMTKDGRALADEAFEKALNEAYDEGYRVGFAAAGKANVTEMDKLG